jgi:hypothetical protein
MKSAKRKCLGMGNKEAQVDRLERESLEEEK